MLFPTPYLLDCEKPQFEFEPDDVFQEEQSYKSSIELLGKKCLGIEFDWFCHCRYSRAWQATPPNAEFYYHDGPKGQSA